MRTLYLARRLSVGLASVSLGNYVAIALAFVTNILLTRTIGPHEFGRLALLLMASQVSLLFVSSWTVAALVRFGAREHAAHGVVARTFWDRLLLMVPGAVFLAVVGIVFGPVVADYLGAPLVALWLVGLHFAVAAMFAAGAAVLQATQRMSRYGLALALDRGAGLLCVVIATRLVPLDAVGALVAYAAGTVLSSTWLFLSIRRLVFVRVPLDRTRMLEFARFSLPIVAGTWAGLFGSQWIDLVIMRRFLPLSDLGVYALSFQIAGAAQQLTTIAGSILLPRFSSLVAAGDTEEIDAILRRVIPYWLLAYGIGLGVLIGLARTLVPLAFGAGFAAATPVLWALLVGAAIAALFATFQALLTAHGLVWPVSIAVVAAVAVNVILDLVLIPPFGIVGSSLATVASYAVSTGITLVAAGTRLRQETGRYVVFLAPPLVAAGCSLVFEGRQLAVTLTAALVVTSLIAARVFDLMPLARWTDLRRVDTRQ